MTDKLLMEYVANAIERRMKTMHGTSDVYDPHTIRLWQAAAAIEAVNSYKHTYTVGVETYKNEWPIPSGAKLRKRPTQK